MHIVKQQNDKIGIGKQQNDNIEIVKQQNDDIEIGEHIKVMLQEKTKQQLDVTEKANINIFF